MNAPGTYELSLDELLERASRTFALTIPLLEGDLRRAMGVAYLLMRNADTLEDAFRIPREKRALRETFSNPLAAP